MTAMTTTTREATERPERGEVMQAGPVFWPAADIYETDEEVVLLMDMPGVAPDGVDVTLERGVLTVRGQAPAESHEGYRQIYAEYGAGTFERVFTISETIDRDRIQAGQKDGVLTLVLPKSAPAKARKIQVSAA